MLTTDVTALSADAPTRLYVIEFDTEHGAVQTFGSADIYRYPKSYLGMDQLESAATGGCYSDPQDHGQVQLWSAEQHYLAAFDDEAAMRAGARAIARAWGDQLPVGIYRVLAA